METQGRGSLPQEFYRRTVERLRRLRPRHIPCVAGGLVLVLVATALGAPRVSDHRLRVPGPAAGVENWLDSGCDGSCPSVQAVAGTETLGDEFSMAFVEFDDAGHFRTDAQLAALRSHADSLARLGRPLYVLVYVHGWNHDARAGDSDVECLAELTRAISMHSGPGDRSALGVYAGWRGRSYRAPLLNKAFSFWGRMNAADRVGYGPDFRRFLGALAELRAGADGTVRVILVGHSLGARALFRATGPIVESEALVGANSSAVSRRIWDAVFLVNPAIAAEDLMTLVDPGLYSVEQPLWVLASKKDRVTRWLYPLSFGVTAPLKPDSARVMAVGNFQALYSDSLFLQGTARPTRPSRIGACQRMSAEALDLVRGPGRTPHPSSLTEYHDVGLFDVDGQRVGAMKLESLRTPGAVRVVSIDTDLLPNHNDIFGAELVEWVVRVVNHQTLAVESQR